MNERPLATGGYLLYSQVGEDFCEIGTIESAEPIEWENYAKDYSLPIVDLGTEITCKFSKKQWKKIQKALGIYKYTFKKVRKGKRIIRVLI